MRFEILFLATAMIAAPALAQSEDDPLAPLDLSLIHIPSPRDA